MKKLSIVICAILLTALVLPLSVSAASWQIIENPTIVLSKATTPTIDGTINTNEGWSAKAMLDEKTAAPFYGSNPLTGEVELYFAYTDDGLYFAANYTDIGSCYTVRFYDAEGNLTHEAAYADPNAGTYKAEPGGYPATTPDGIALNYYKVDDNTTSAPAGVIPDACFWNVFAKETDRGNDVILSTGEDTIDKGRYGWDGDTICLALDLLGEFEKEAFMASNDYTPLYCFSLFEDGSVRVARTQSDNNAEITEDCKTAGKKTDNGFCFEGMIPWDTIVEDTNALGATMGLEKTFTKAEIIADGAIHRAAVTLQDRFLDPEVGENDTYGRYITVCAKTLDGDDGFKTSGDNIKAYGLKLAMGTADGGDAGTTSGSANGGTTAAGGAATTKAASTGNKGTGSGTASQTFDAGIAVAIGALAASGIGVFYTSKKRK